MPADPSGPAPLATAAAPGKLILLGEHAVVYGRPALAVPVHAVKATATVWPAASPLVITSRVVGNLTEPTWRVAVDTAPDTDPLATAARTTLDRLGSQALPSWSIEITSDIPVARGMGSSAAVAVAVVRVIAKAAGVDLDHSAVAAAAFEAERCTHGTPSGIDNTVIAWERPICFRQGQGTPLPLPVPLYLMVADSGQRGATSELVAGVRIRRGARPEVYEAWFNQIERLVNGASAALAAGDLARVGRAMDSNHLVLQAMQLSTPELDNLIAAARYAGALGAKLSGAGGGGVIVALVEPQQAPAVSAALAAAGAVRVIQTIVPATAALP
jgi:mevalonate kinase